MYKCQNFKYEKAILSKCKAFDISIGEEKIQIGNLGKYQDLTVLAKAYGDPETFLKAIYSKGLRNGLMYGLLIGLFMRSTQK